MSLCIDCDEGLSDASDLGPGEADDAIGVFEASHCLDERLQVNLGLIRTEDQRFDGLIGFDEEVGEHDFIRGLGPRDCYAKILLVGEIEDKVIGLSGAGEPQRVVFSASVIDRVETIPLLVKIGITAQSPIEGVCPFPAGENVGINPACQPVCSITTR